VSSARPGSELVRRTVLPFASVISYVRVLRARRSGQGAKAKRAPGPAVAVRAGPDEHDLALLLLRRQRRVGIGERRRARVDGLGQRAHALVREQHALERVQVVQELLGRRVRHLRVVEERAQALLLQRRHARVQLVSTGPVGVARPRVLAVGAGQLDVVDRRHRAPDVCERLRGGRVRDRIHELHVRRQREGDAHEAVLAQVAPVGRILAVRPEIVRVDRPEERIVRVRMEPAQPLEELEAPLDVHRRELEAVGRHVAVGAGPSVARQAVRAAVEEVEEATRDRVAGLPAAEPVESLRRRKLPPHPFDRGPVPSGHAVLPGPGRTAGEHCRRREREPDATCPRLLPAHRRLQGFLRPRRFGRLEAAR
jgi:hypothetical protein